ncbi:hypothetical protein EOD41_15040 [Mucilaginibacter limnophilus]|uniref:Coenzyme F420 hydrogenase n=1 Tax=Mucilaginibacter limnophilus TaxID=1932778 RepID=A0A437MQ33_9SPHI|nr:Coenzyme F420 hydrogenase/dehydrogenase, beta subunit C-terminal domain [Mucilaginibacter limnophilus]RVT99758.1 hypothetical protein EOD41_15040 [Mucilaginibacter limnophilus]
MEANSSNIQNLNKVVRGGYCVGCGACSFVGGTEMKINDYGEYYPDLSSFSIENNTATTEKMEFVCPSLNPQFNENVLAASFLNNCDNPSKYIGPFQDVYAGYVKEGQYRNNGTSGGFGTWVGAELFMKGMIDGVIHVKENKREGALDPFFKYGISTTIEEITKGARTKYHVIEVSEILQMIKDKPGKYLFIGLPCMVKAIRRVQLVDPVIKDSIIYTAALVCGHLKSINWTLSLGWGKGILPENAVRFKYRTKADDIPARAYVFTAYAGDYEIREDSGNVVGGKFNQGALMLPACNFCDDVVGETADLTIGDAWLPQFEIDSSGTNLLIVRNSELNDLVNAAKVTDRVYLEDLTEKDAISAQSGGFRQRRDGLSYRLEKVDRKGLWRPIKRVKPGEFIMPPLRKLIYAMRFDVTLRSRENFKTALQRNDYNYYKQRMQVQLKLLRLLEISSSASRIIKRKISYFRLKQVNK